MYLKVDIKPKANSRTFQEMISLVEAYLIKTIKKEQMVLFKVL